MYKRKIPIIALYFLLLLVSIPKVGAQSNSISLPFKEDVYVEENFPTTSPWNNRNMYLGKDKIYEKGRTRIFLKPDYSELVSKRVSPNKITSAVLNMTSYVYQGTKNSMQITPYQVLSPWSMFTINWNNQPSLLKKYAEVTIPTVNGHKLMDITEILAASYTNYITSQLDNGLSLRFSSEDNLGFVFWKTGCEYTIDEPRCNQGDAPSITITYTQNNPPSGCSIISPEINSYSNSKDVSVHINLATDPDNDPLLYKINACSNENCDTILSSSATFSDAEASIHLEDGDYYLSCVVSDGFEQTHSSTIAVHVDTVAPNPPIIFNEPSFTAGTENTILWNSNASNEYYQLVWSTSKTFSNALESQWISQMSFTVTDLLEKVYYYKVRAKDLAGNISEWSEITYSTQDTTLPTVQYFKTNTTITHPKIDNSGGIYDTFYIQGRFEDKNLSEIRLEIFNSKNESVYSLTDNTKSYLWVHWPTKEADFIDDNYTVILSATDKTGHLSISDPLILQIDTRAPPQATITGVLPHKVYNTTSFNIIVECLESTGGKLYLNNKVLSSFENKISQKLQLKDDDYKIKVLCTDGANNSSERLLNFSVDTTPPKPPKIKIDEQNDNISFSLACSEKGKAELFIDGSDKKDANCESNSSVTWTIKKEDMPYGTVFITARVSDTLNNWSDLSGVDFENEMPARKIEVNQLKCEANYNFDSHTVANISCPWDKLLPTFLEQTSLSKHDNTITMTLRNTLIPEVNLNLHLVYCQPLTFWNPFTWFGCAQKELTTIPLWIPLVPHLFVDNSSVPYLSLAGNNYEYQIDSQPKETIVVKYQFEGGKMIDYQHESIILDVTSPVLEQKFTIKDAVTSKNIPPLAWPLAHQADVSQWHGNTVFQHPHAGIDFSVYKDQIVATARGTVVSKGFSQSSQCFAGGYYIGIKHENGLFTYYFHLESEPKLRINDTVTAGQILGTTGNTGLYNCSKLAYHLHFETRTSQKAADHTNPVPLINVDWSQVKTSKAKTNPGRLSGDNPHPNY